MVESFASVTDIDDQLRNEFILKQLIQLLDCLDLADTAGRWVVLLEIILSLGSRSFSEYCPKKFLDLARFFLMIRIVYMTRIVHNITRVKAENTSHTKYLYNGYRLVETISVFFLL